MKHGSIWNVQRKIRTLTHGQPSQFHWSVQRARMIEPSCNSSLLPNTVSHPCAHTSAHYISIHMLNHTDASVHTDAHPLAATTTAETHTQSSLHTRSWYTFGCYFFPYSIAWCSYRFKPRFLLLFPPPSYIHSVTLSISFVRSLHVCKCACLFFVLLFFHSSPEASLFVKFRMCALLLHRFWVHRFSIFFRTSSSATKNFVSKRTVPKLISKNRK